MTGPIAAAREALGDEFGAHRDRACRGCLPDSDVVGCRLAVHLPDRVGSVFVPSVFLIEAWHATACAMRGSS